ncbi:hypothetical protein MRX96_028877 [Rhipicephalus microplus]
MPRLGARKPMKVASPTVARRQAKASVPYQNGVAVAPLKGVQSSDEPAATREKSMKPPAELTRLKTTNCSLKSTAVCSLVSDAPALKGRPRVQSTSNTRVTHKPPQGASSLAKVTSPALTRSRAKALLQHQRNVKVVATESFNSSDKPAELENMISKPSTKRGGAETRNEVPEKKHNLKSKVRRHEKHGASDKQYLHNRRSEVRSIGPEKMASHKCVGQKTTVTRLQHHKAEALFPPSDVLSTCSGKRRRQAPDEMRKFVAQNGYGRSTSKRHSLRLARLSKIASDCIQEAGKRDSASEPSCFQRTPISQTKKVPEASTPDQRSQNGAIVWLETPVKARTPDRCRRKLFGKDYKDTGF